jgi:hypothetical protein
MVMALVRLQRVGIGVCPPAVATALDLSWMHALPNASLPGAASEFYLIGDKCFAVGVGVFGPIGTSALLSATFFAALAIDWVRVPVRPLPPFSICLFLHVLMNFAADHMLGLTRLRRQVTEKMLERLDAIGRIAKIRKAQQTRMITRTKVVSELEVVQSKLL